jgi:hypothetical protein
MSPWLDDDDVEIITDSLMIDDIDTYLNEPPIHASSVAAAGGALKWWYAQEKQRPTVASMAMDFISAPRELFLCPHRVVTGADFISQLPPSRPSVSSRPAADP